MCGQQALSRLQILRERRVTGVAGRGFDRPSASRSDADCNHGEGNGETAASLFAGTLKISGRRLQSVIDVDCPHRQIAERPGARLNERSQQTRRILTAAQRDDEAGGSARRMSL